MVLLPTDRRIYRRVIAVPRGELTVVDLTAADGGLAAVAFEAAPVGMAVCAPDGRWLLANPALRRIVGGAEVQLVDLDRLAAPSDSYEADARLARADGTGRWVRVRAAAVRDETGRIAHVVCEVEDVTRRRAAEIGLVHAATHDQLTQAANRTVLMDRLAQGLARNRRTTDVVGVLFCDIDGFKSINDRLGHQAGDDVLREVAGRLQATIRPNDTLARMGGDEFVILTPNLTSEGQIGLLAARAQRAVEPPVTARGVSIDVSISIGAAVGRAGADAEALIAEADRAMYRAKGRRPDARVPD